MDKQVLVISNLDVGDKTFTSDTGTWNISRAMRDCKAGKHKCYGFGINELYEATKRVEVDKKKLAKLSSRSLLAKAPPIILIAEHGKVWVIDGHHRIHASRRVGISKITGYVIEEPDSAPYIVWYNGQRTMPGQHKP
jgi:hypothetical protein